MDISVFFDTKAVVAVAIEQLQQEAKAYNPPCVGGTSFMTCEESCHAHGRCEWQGTAQVGEFAKWQAASAPRIE